VWHGDCGSLAWSITLVSAMSVIPTEAVSTSLDFVVHLSLSLSDDLSTDPLGVPAAITMDGNEFRFGFGFGSVDAVSATVRKPLKDGLDSTLVTSVGLSGGTSDSVVSGISLVGNIGSKVINLGVDFVVGFVSENVFGAQRVDIGKRPVEATPPPLPLSCDAVDEVEVTGCELVIVDIALLSCLLPVTPNSP